MKLKKDKEMIEEKYEKLRKDVKESEQKLRNQVLELSTTRSSLEEKVTNLEFKNKEIEDRRVTESSMLQKELSKIRDSTSVELERLSSELKMTKEKLVSAETERNDKTLEL